MSLRSNKFVSTVAASVIVVGAIFVSGCNLAGAGPQPGATTTLPVTAVVNPPVDIVDAPVFDGKKSFDLLKKQCDFGPRPVGSEAHRKTLSFLVEEMKKYADKTVQQTFTYQGLPLCNVIGEFNPEAKRKVLLCAHWDTRPRADQELDEVNKRKPIIGASDGASGVAVLLELARNFKEKKPNIGVVVVLLDGEDFGSFETMKGVLLGAEYFARHHDGYNLEYGVLLDMVGDADLDIYREVNSENYAPGTNRKIFTIAKELGFGKNIIDKLNTNVTDDHIPLNQARIPTVDLIDFNYKYWHTLEDTPEHCSAKSLEMVGKTISQLIYREK